ncbi:hypothetical protein Cphy_3918 [Lachnoclostridium phytofermentans ISDg]|uniref:Uncharacterized protein n=2 Tax=Lachnoclostridium phytofermentans TaxID=66219 RepID=A9KLV6_LACP7|nr:hypothetical protein Cphy_3918 [Lachnoclostridium phytofermentans ISDg]
MSNQNLNKRALDLKSSWDAVDGLLKNSNLLKKKVGTTDNKPADNKPNTAGNKPNTAGNKPNNAGNRPNNSGNRPNNSGNKPNASGNKPSK